MESHRIIRPFLPFLALNVGQKIGDNFPRADFGRT
jgi:hypothetical protein